ncbi:D-xylose reductase [Entomortierella parvispora]|uniref:D-xylose reductase n=1 Tax=Entomortierella parvispora TaxID=205924 RepID=A0A9P3LU89_9FUNG|nr:D-xylose reductase [Entomortierella parvispora]
MTSKTVTLQPGNHEMPLLGFGTWKIPKDQAASVVFKAIESGYRLIDCACDYGNEVEVGQGIKMAIEKGIVTREELFITSKLWNTYHHKEHVPMAFERTLKDLGLEYIDLYLIHFPISLKYVPFETRYPPEWGNMEQDPVPVHETWAAMEALVATGKVRNIGVSNFSAILLMDVLSYAKVKPAVLHVEVHPYLNNSALIKFAKSQGLQITGYSNFGPASYVAFNDAAAKATPLFEEERLSKIAAHHKKTVAQVILRWLVQDKIAVIPKSADTTRMAQNADIFGFELSSSEMDTINSMDINFRLNDPAVYANIPIYA